MVSPVNNPRIIVSLDFPSADEALALVRRLDPGHCRVKVGKELFTSSGPGLVETLAGQGFDVFLDMKFHDIPNTVAGACRAAVRLGVWMMNIHASGGRSMLEAARAAVDSSGHRPLLIGVTVLTSLTSADLSDIGVSENATDHVVRLARLAESSGLDGVVCSPQEVAMLRQGLGDRFVLVTPGIRPAGAANDDQRRIMTPSQAIRAGSDFLVIGRPITQAPDPLQALLDIEKEMNAVGR
jgi:orotidine-5'-phosphate decarboxylase